MSFSSEVVIENRNIGPKYAPYIVAELSANHLGSLDRALTLIREAAGAGVEAVKLQTYTADTLTIDHDGDDFMINSGPWAGRTLYDLYEEASTPWEWHEELFSLGRKLGVTVFSSPFDASAVDYLEELNCPAYKIASFEIMDLALIEKVAKTGKPVIISTGIAKEGEIEDALKTLIAADCNEAILLHCVSAYPTPVEESNLLKIPHFSMSYDIPVGLSDHTPGTQAAVVAVGLGAVMVEKHFTLAREEGGPDSAFSLEPEELKRLCSDCREGWKALGSTDGSSPSIDSSRVFRRSLYIVQDVKRGESLSEENIRSIRPGWGLAPRHLHEILGRTFKQDASRGTPLDWSLID